MTTILLEFAIRTSLIAAGTAAVLWTLRIKTASVRHAAWSAVVLTMLVLPLLLAGRVRMSLPVLTPSRPATETATTGASARPTTPVESPASDVPDAMAAHATVPAPAPPRLPIDGRLVATSAYAAGALILLLRLVVGTIQATRLRRSAVVHDGRLTSDRCTTPITVGWFSQALILPGGWQQWPASKLDAVLTHEREHARRHDPLVQWLALLNRAIFWFHPLAWWLERRLATLAEEACDAAVLAAGHSPHDYSEYLLDMARTVTRQHGRVRIVGMAMPGAGLPDRMRLIFQGLPAVRLSRARLIATIAFCALSSMMFAAGSLRERRPQQDAAQSPIKFDVVSIKPCAELPPPGAGRGAPPWAGQISPGYLHWDCVKLSDLIDQAYTGDDNQLLNVVKNPRPDSPKRVRGGPSWIDDDRFTIEIKMSGDASVARPEGAAQRFLPVRDAMKPALRAMLEDRFQLKLRKATEEQPMYALTVAKNGLNPERVKPVVSGDCRTQLRVTVGDTRLPDDVAKLPACGTTNLTRPRGNFATRYTSYSMAQFATALSSTMDRYVLDKTGIAGRFNFGYEFGPDASTPGTAADDEFEAKVREASERMGMSVPPRTERPAPDGPSIFKALDQLGLKLEPTRGPSEYLQIESAQRPRPNLAEAPVNVPVRAHGSGPAGGPSDAAEQPHAPAPSTVTAPAATQNAFDVVSIKPCADVASAQTGRGAGPNLAQTSPGHVFWACVTLASLVDQAYAGWDFPLLNTQGEPLAFEPFPDGRPGRTGTSDVRDDGPSRVRGGPSWMFSDRFAIEATASPAVINPPAGAVNLMRLPGPMNQALRAMLADRFQLKVRRQTEQQPMYALTVASGGLKIKPPADGDCIVFAPGMPRSTPSGTKGYCGSINETTPLGRLQQMLAGQDRAKVNAMPGPDRRMEVNGVTLQKVAERLAKVMDRFVLDKTGVGGEFMFAFEYLKNDNTPGASFGISLMANDAASRASISRAVSAAEGRELTIFEALAVLGLKLEPTKGPAEYLVVDSVQKPRPNWP